MGSLKFGKGIIALYKAVLTLRMAKIALKNYG